MPESPVPLETELPPEVERTTRQLVRSMGLAQATSVNMLEMIGIGPFITIGTIIAAMGGPQAILGWLLGAVVAICDGLVYAELGAAMPGAGGAYIYFREAFNRLTWGRLFSFLFLWETIFVAPLSIAAACVGFGDYLGYALGFAHRGITLTAIGVCIAVAVLLYRPIRSVGRLSVVFLVIVLAAMLWVVVAGTLHMNPRMAFDFPPHAFRLSSGFFAGLGSATLFALYNYGGYNNITYLGGEVRQPVKNIPRAIVLSILAVAVLYLLMSVTIIGTIPWQQAATSNAVVSEFITKLYGARAGVLITVLILIATFGGIFTMTLGYSRILFAAGAEGQFFKVFGRVHPRGHFPTVALVAVAALALPLCGLPIEKLVAALIIIQVLFQFILQVVAVFVIRTYRREIAVPFRMWLYPWPALVALAGWIYVALTPAQRPFVWEGAILMAAGVVAYLLRARVVKEWPLA
ncbi:MAG TPA: APC family permease [Terriglobia bacterium]|nr:APC family permease [Terriglobia bacterium]